MQNNKKYKILGLSLSLVVLFVPIFVLGQINSSENSNKDLIYDIGVIVYIPLEGGFFGIVSDDGKSYDPINLSSKFEIDGLRVIFVGEILEMYSIHMWGEIMRILFIQIEGVSFILFNFISLLFI